MIKIGKDYTIVSLPESYHALKIGAEKVAQYKAQKEGIT